MNPSRQNSQPNVFIQQTLLPQQTTTASPVYYHGAYGDVGQSYGVGGGASSMAVQQHQLGSMTRPMGATGQQMAGSYGYPVQQHQNSPMAQMGSPVFVTGPGSLPQTASNPASVGTGPASVSRIDQPTTPMDTSSINVSQPQSSLPAVQFPAQQSKIPPAPQQQQQPVTEQQSASRTPMSTIELPYSPEILNKLDQMSPMSLATVGRELVHEVMHRTHLLTNLLKNHTGGRMPQQANQANLLDLLKYCEMIMRRITEVGVRLDRFEQKNGSVELTENDYLEIIMVSGRAEERTEKLEALKRAEEKLSLAKEEYRRNRKRLSEISAAQKEIEWESAVFGLRQHKKTTKNA